MKTMAWIMAFVCMSGAVSFGTVCSSDLGGDINGDCVVDLNDYALLAIDWMACSIPYGPPSSGSVTTDVYYAAPNGTGDGTSDSNPMTIADFWDVAEPGTTLILLDGVYQGANNMIQPTGLVHGEPGDAITILAQNDGGVTIDGQGMYEPVKLFRNSHMRFIGFNAKNSSNNVVLVEQSNHVSFSRVCGWDARDGNCMIFKTVQSQYVLYEDCAGWGFARIIFLSTNYADYVTYRRCWASWDGCHTIGPKWAYNTCYDSVGGLVDNCVGTWTASLMQETYYLLSEEQPDGYHRNPQGELVQMTGYQVQDPQAIISRGDFHYIASEATGTVVKNSIAYTRDIFPSSVSVPIAHFQARTETPDDTYLFSNCMAWEAYSNGDVMRDFSLDQPGADAVNVQSRVRNSEVTNGATISYGQVDTSSLLPLPIHDRVVALTGHDMTRYIPAGTNNTYYVSPTGTGKGLTSGDPMSVSLLMQLIQGGDTAILQDGVYTGDSLLHLPANVKGNSSLPILIRADNDGQAIIDGQGTGVPLKMHGNQYWTIEGLQLRNSSSNVVELNNCLHVTLSKITAHGTGIDSSVYKLWYCNDINVENCAGWGSACSIFRVDEACSNIDFSYCFAQWEEGLGTSVKSGFTTFNADNVNFDKCVSLWAPTGNGSTAAAKGGFYSTLSTNVVLQNCAARNRSTLVQPEGLYYLAGPAAPDQPIQMHNCVAISDTSGVYGGRLSYCTGGPIEGISCSIYQDPTSNVTEGTTDVCDQIGNWPLQSRILAESGADVESVYCQADITEWYASPDGTGDGTSPSTPMKICDFRPLAQAGRTLYLLDGVYTGADSMIQMSPGVHGTPTEPIVITTYNQVGPAVTIDGEGVNIPLQLGQNDYWCVENINLRNSSSHVCSLVNADYCTFSNVCAWNSGDSSSTQAMIYYLNNSSNVLFEDCAGWGNASQIFSLNTDCTDITYRRCWASWDHANYNFSQKTCFAIAAGGSSWATAENCISRWNADASYNNAKGGFATTSGLTPVDASLTTCVAYNETGVNKPNYSFYYIVGPSLPDRTPVNDCVAWVLPSTPTESFKGFYLFRCSGGPVEAIHCDTASTYSDSTVTVGTANLPTPFDFPVNGRIINLLGYDVLGTLGLD